MIRLQDIIAEMVSDGATFADLKQAKDIAKSITDKIPGSSFGIKNKYGIRVIKFNQATEAEVTNAAKQVGLKSTGLKSPEQTSASSSKKKKILGFQDGNNIKYTATVPVGKNVGGVDTCGIQKKELTPTGLGIAGKTFSSKSELVNSVKAAISVKIRDQAVKNAVLHLVDIADRKKNDTLTKEELDAIQCDINYIAQDFGEILAPIYIMGPTDRVEFPSGNNPIVDVKVNGKGYAIKSLTGSANSFAVISDLLDKYETTLPEEGTPKKIFNIIKNFHKSATGSVKDKLIKACFAAETAESKKLAELLGGVPNSTEQLEVFVKNKITKNGKPIHYGSFLRNFYPMMMAGDWGKPTGLPFDGKYYMQLKPEGPVPPLKEAGKADYDRDPVKGASNVLIYALGVGLYNYATKGSSALEYDKMMTDIMRQSDVHLGKINITNTGGIQVTTIPFANVKFKFDYHAPSHKPGNNAPGFVIAR
jgi:hypothetical protein